MRRILFALVQLVVAWLAFPASAFAGTPGACVGWDDSGYCVEWEVPTPGTPGNPGSGGGNGGGSPTCYWRNTVDLTDKDVAFYIAFGIPIPPVGAEIRWQEWYCPDGSGNNYRWVLVDEPPTPGELASIARGRLAGLMPPPQVSSSPAPGVASIVGVPSFVAVENWTGVLTDRECAGGLCVTVTAVPALTFNPGEPGSEPMACAGSGSRFVVGSSSAVAQAAVEGACAWVYELRTGVDGRPGEWPGEVSVQWSISWTATSGVSGSVPSVTRSVAVPRPVAEVQTLLVGGATP